MRAKRRNTYRRMFLFAAAAAAILIMLLAGSHRISAESELSSEKATRYYMSYEIMPGDSLWSIAGNFRDPGSESIASYMDEVRSINCLSSDSLRAGSRICIPYYPEEQ